MFTPNYWPFRTDLSITSPSLKRRAVDTSLDPLVNPVLPSFLALTNDTPRSDLDDVHRDAKRLRTDSSDGHSSDVDLKRTT